MPSIGLVFCETSLHKIVKLMTACSILREYYMVCSCFAVYGHHIWSRKRMVAPKKPMKFQVDDKKTDALKRINLNVTMVTVEDDKRKVAE